MNIKKQSFRKPPLLKPEEFPVILSPSIGCPLIAAAGNAPLEITVMVAAMDEDFGGWSLVPSSSNENSALEAIKLVEKGKKKVPWESPVSFASLEETKDYISKELFLNVLGGEAEIYKVSLSLEKFEDALSGFPVSALFDLCLKGPVFLRKPHAVSLTKKAEGELKFIHFTDQHLARRNDLIKNSIENVMGPLKSFNNFNENTREFIKTANRLAEKGELDFVLMGGDIIDFVNHGVSDEVNPADNNWQVFIELFTGSGHESKRKNHGIKVPVFTTTGNHDWRYHPYDISANCINKTFGISENEAANFDYQYYDSKQRLVEKQNEIYRKIMDEGSPIARENFLHSFLRRLLAFLTKPWGKLFASSLCTAALWILNVVKEILALENVQIPDLQTVNVKSIFDFLAKDVYTDNLAGISIALFFALLLLFALLPRILYRLYGLFENITNVSRQDFARYLLTRAVIPIEAGVNSLHYYFLHINPYFNYAFTVCSHHFIMMDTGPDCFTGQFLWDSGNRKVKVSSIKDSIIGGSPDSMAFYPPNRYYSQGQITWLENVLKAIHQLQNEGKGKIFVCLHAPPINVRKRPVIKQGQDEILLDKNRINATYGTINHFLSQFFHLCVGRKENGSNYKGPKVDVVFCGHAHQNIEFRIDNDIRIHYGNYSANVPPGKFNENPYVLQTAAGGPADKDFDNPPYFRTINIDVDGKIESLKHN